MKKSTKNPLRFAPKLPKIRKKKLKKWLLFSCVFNFAGTVDDSVFCNHFSLMSKLVIFGYPIATPSRKSRSDIWNMVDIFFIADDVYPTPPLFQSWGRNKRSIYTKCSLRDTSILLSWYKKVAVIRLVRSQSNSLHIVIKISFILGVEES